MMAQCKSGTQNERSYGRYERFPCLVTRRLDFGQLIAGVDPPVSECSDLAPVALLVQGGCGFQRTLNNCHSCSDEWFERERRDTIVYSGKPLTHSPSERNSATQNKPNTTSERIVSLIPIWIW
jgi:hypothetical protein